jgi:hypothetical protein
MGTTFSRFRLAVQSLRQIAAVYEQLNKRIQQSPGIPVLHPSTPYWAIPASPIAQHGSSDATPLPSCVDIVIIGSGMTAAAFARTMLGFGPAGSNSLPQIVVLEARDACSGATGRYAHLFAESRASILTIRYRNGGHITPLVFHDYLALKKEHGAEMAKSIIEFRLAHLAGKFILYRQSERIY